MHAAILILLPIAAAAIGMTAFVIAFYIAEKGVQICRRYSITSSAGCSPRQREPNEPPAPQAGLRARRAAHPAPPSTWNNSRRRMRTSPALGQAS
jgi:hypothetical protein